MQDYEITTRFSPGTSQGASSIVTIFDADAPPCTIQLNQFHKPVVTFGRDPKNDIVLHSHLVSSQHGRFVYRNEAWVMEDKAAYQATGSTNGLIYNNLSVRSRILCDGDLVRIDDGVESVPEGVLFLFSSEVLEHQWQICPLSGVNEVTIGRDPSCHICLPHVSVSKLHAKISRAGNGFYLSDNNSTNGVIRNNRKVSGREPLHEKDVISITNAQFIFTSSALYYFLYKSGISVDATDIVIRRGKGRKSFITCNHADLHIEPGELVAIIGGSGAGKSTILNCMCGYLTPAQGSVYINGVDLYQNFDALKKIIGYVPQSDIVYDDLSLEDMLTYTAKLRLPKDTTAAERDAAIRRALETVELTEKRSSRIGSLSGGQRKRASIAVELLSDPNLLFLDEPVSGLDPGTERNLMGSLRQMADSGKTVVLVTHSTLQLKLCDKIVFMGRGGNLCYYGSYDDALAFFEVSDVVDIYDKITRQPEHWAKRYRETTTPAVRRTAAGKPSGQKEDGRLRQLGVLCARYLKLVCNDRQRLLLLLCQAPILALLISFVADGQQFEQYEMTKSLLFALSCSAFWIGMLNSIQEVCKERTILKREYMTGLSLSSYIFSKLIILGALSLLQSLLVTGVFALLVGLPETGVMFAPYSEILITSFLTAVASAAMGLFVSCLFTNADRAMTVAPILLMPQILFSGLIFKLDGAAKPVSWLTVCRWSMEGYGTTADLNSLPLRLQQEGISLPHEAESFFEFTQGHLLFAWFILLLFLASFLLMARLSLSKIRQDG